MRLVQYPAALWWRRAGIACGDVLRTGGSGSTCSLASGRKTQPTVKCACLNGSPLPDGVKGKAVGSGKGKAHKG